MELSRKDASLQNILRFAVENTNSEDASNSSISNALDEKKKDFLNNALKVASFDVMREIKEAIGILEHSGASHDEKELSLNVIRNSIDHIDIANSVVKIGGTKTILKYVKSEDNDLRIIAIYIVSEMSQNNPFCQQHFLDEKIINVLVCYFYEREDLSRSSIQAISALVRNFEPGLIEFLNVGGIKAVMHCLDSKFPKVYIKAAFLLATLSAEQKHVRDEFAKQNAMQLLMLNVEHVNGFDIKIEITLCALSSLSTSAIWKGSSQINLTNVEATMSEVIVKYSNMPECEDMVRYAQEVITNLKKTTVHS